MSDVTTVVDTYISMWNETDAGRRAEQIEQSWTDDARYVDPVLAAEGRSGLSSMVERVHAQFPGHRFRRTSAVDTHNNRVRFGWELVDPAGAVTVAGIDVGELGPDGKLQSVTGFFGELAPV